MKIVQKIKNYKEQKPSVLTIGTFDGVHLGHQKIIKSIVTEARTKRHLAVVLTFFPHPRKVLQNDDIKLIDTLKEKEQILKSLGVDVLVIQPFSKEFSKLTPLEFINDILVNTFKISKIIIGYNHRFGRDRKASVEDLKQYGNLYNFKVKEILPQEIDSINISSTKVREAISNGKIESVTRYLNRPFKLSGIVVQGLKIGRTLNFPTANIEVKEEYKLIPPNGVYQVQSIIKNKLIFGMMNIGVRPTLGKGSKSIEIHFFDFDMDLYHQELTVEFLSKIREEHKFDSLEKLKKQILKDKKKCIQLFKTNNLVS